MIGTQKADVPGRESMVARLDKRLHQQAVEWAQVEGVHVRAVIDAVLWDYFTRSHRHEAIRRSVMERARAISESIRTQGRAKAEESLPRWRRPPSKRTMPEPILIPPPPRT